MLHLSRKAKIIACGWKDKESKSHVDRWKGTNCYLLDVVERLIWTVPVTGIAIPFRDYFGQNRVAFYNFSVLIFFLWSCSS